MKSFLNDSFRRSVNFFLLHVYEQNGRLMFMIFKIVNLRALLLLSSHRFLFLTDTELVIFIKVIFF